jgi:retron-type reverse transcriptase
MGNSDSIDFSLSNLYKSWHVFRAGKRASSEIMQFEYYLESHLSQIHKELTSRTYRHGQYAQYVVQDSKKREIAVAPVRDRLLHRLLYDYLMPSWNNTFIYDAWSCRPNKGQHRAIERSADFMQRYRSGYVWRADIHKFFDSVDQITLFKIISRRTLCPNTLWLIREILSSFSKNPPSIGIPIGNLTSQVFANIYFNEFDRYMVHTLKPNAYLRYGDDWLCFADNEAELYSVQQRAIHFLANELNLMISPRLNHVTPVYKGVTYLGIDLWPTGKRITKATRIRMERKLNCQNFASYEALERAFSTDRTIKRFYWRNVDT